MSQPSPASPASHLRQWRWPALLVLAVAAAHWMLLAGAPGIVVALGGREAGPDTAGLQRPFTTRTFRSAEAPAPPTQMRMPPPARPARASQPQAQRTPAEGDSASSGAALANGAQAVTTSALAGALPPGDALTPADGRSQVPESAGAVTAIAAATAVATAPGASASMPAPAESAPALPRYAFPGSTRLKYETRGQVKGFDYYAKGELLWLQDASSYDARLEISHFLLGSRVQTSKGVLTPEGLAPLRFGDKGRGSSEVAAHFQRGKGIVSFSANTPDVPLTPGAQDQLSVLLQLSSLVGGEPERFVPGSLMTFQAVGPRSSEVWVFKVNGPERLDLPGGAMTATRITRDPTGDYETRVEIWLAPDLQYLPARIRLTQTSGDFAELLWRSTQNP